MPCGSRSLGEGRKVLVGIEWMHGVHGGILHSASAAADVGQGVALRQHCYYVVLEHSTLFIVIHVLKIQRNVNNMKWLHGNE